MAQILKENVRQSIIDSAIEELLEYGYQKSSMRRIADKAKMTVGNLYRYFKNKDEMVSFIVRPIMEQIDTKVRALTEESVSLQGNTFNFQRFDDQKILYALDRISVELVELYKSHPRTMRIIMMEGSYNQGLLKWCSELIYQLMKNRYDFKEEESQKYHLLAQMHTSSMFAGIRECLNNSDLKEEETSEVIQRYFHGFMNGLLEK